MVIEMTQEEFAKLTKKRPRRNKYNARKVRLDGYTFDSQVEAARYGELKLLERVGKIRDLEVHPKFVLQEAFEDQWGRKWKAVTYTADFGYREDGQKIVEDVKGGKVTQTQSFRDKSALFQAKYPYIKFVIEER